MLSWSTFQIHNIAFYLPDLTYASTFLSIDSGAGYFCVNSSVYSYNEEKSGDQSYQYRLRKRLEGV